ncbi:Poly(A)-specific ribonuclease [Bertholletia excelsa]
MSCRERSTLTRRRDKYTGVMRGADGLARPPAENSVGKRRYRDAEPRNHDRHLSKKQKLQLSDTETPIQKPLILHSSASSSQTHHIRRHQRHHGRRKSKSSGAQDFRKWVYSSRDLSGCKDTAVIVSYNILGVENASNHLDLYSDISPKFLDWHHRKKLLCKEISQYNANILCFQEVDRFHDLDKLLRKDGFQGVYQARTGEACDGCAIFWKSEMFTLLHLKNIEFQKFGLRNNVAQLCVLKMNQSPSISGLDTQTSEACLSRTFLVGNIHVLFNPNRGDIKIGQIRLFLEKAHELSEEWGSIPVVLAGDFNSTPLSAVYQFLASSVLDLEKHDRRKMSGQICPLEYEAFRSRNNYASSSWNSTSKSLIYRWSDQELRIATGAGGLTCITHPLKLCSAYLGVHGSCRTRDNYGEPLATSYHSKFMGTVDYIWHSQELIPVRVLDTLPIDILRKNGGLPSKDWGSDHLALVCELAFADNGNG